MAAATMSLVGGGLRLRPGVYSNSTEAAAESFGAHDQVVDLHLSPPKTSFFLGWRGGMGGWAIRQR